MNVERFYVDQELVENAFFDEIYQHIYDVAAFSEASKNYIPDEKYIKDLNNLPSGRSPCERVKLALWCQRGITIGINFTSNVWYIILFSLCMVFSLSSIIQNPQNKTPTEIQSNGQAKFNNE